MLALSLESGCNIPSDFIHLLLAELVPRINSFQTFRLKVINMVKLYIIVFKQYEKKTTTIKKDTITVVCQNGRLLIFVHSCKMQICQINSAYKFILNRFNQNFTEV